MSKRSVAPVALSFVMALGLAGCGGNPIGREDDEETTPPEDGEVVTEGGGSAGESVTVYAETTSGQGFVKNIKYDAATNTYNVDNLGFDADNTYRAGAPVSTLNGYNVYEPDDTVIDPVSGVTIQQFQHRMVAGVSRSGRTSFNIVRTGAYKDYGFGGFILQRQGGTTPPASLPSTGQAAFTGNYAGLRDFNGKTGLQYVTGRMQVDIDFRDFNDGDAVKGKITDRHIYDMNGTDITGDVLDSIGTKYGARPSVLPTLVFDVGPGAIDNTGQIHGTLSSEVLDLRGGVKNTVLESGNYYGILSGSGVNGPDELVGIVVVTGEDPALDNVEVRETGGFILYRPE
ncbi:MAG: hypothetical protein QM656_17065 [Paracoccaceae bacterium]